MKYSVRSKTLTLSKLINSALSLTSKPKPAAAASCCTVPQATAETGLVQEALFTLYRSCLYSFVDRPVRDLETQRVTVAH